MRTTAGPRRVNRVTLSIMGLVAAIGSFSSPARAVELVLTYTGTIHAADSLTAAGGPDLITADSLFTFVARFDTSTPNIVGPLPRPGPGSGFVAYVPSQASFTIGGVNYALTGLGAGNGPTITIFDASNIFNPGRYGVGLVVNPLADGAGFVGDFLSASPGFSVASLGPTTFQNFAGAGYSAGIGCGPDAALCTFQPINLISGNQLFSLQFAGLLGARDGGISYDGGTATATLSAVPEPATWAMMLLGFGGIGIAVRRRRSSALMQIA